MGSRSDKVKGMEVNMTMTLCGIFRVNENIVLRRGGEGGGRGRGG